MATRPLALLLAPLALACVPPDCDHVDEGSCVNACCKLSWDLPGVDARAFIETVSSLLSAGGPDGRFARYDNLPPVQMWAHQGTYVVQGNHTTEKGTYVDLVQVAAEPTADGGARAYAFSHSQDLIPGEFAWSDFGQNYKNLALIIQAAGVAEYDETTLFGCPPPPAAAPAPLPSELVGAWRRDFERYGPSESASLRVHYVQGASLFSDVRVPRDRPARLLEATSLDDYDEDDLALLAEAHGFAGGTNYAAFADGEASSQWLGNLTWHHVLTDWADVCVDPSRSWSAWRNGTDVSHDLGAIELVDAAPRVLHEHAYPVDTPVVQYEQWRALTAARAPTLALAWPAARPGATPTALLVVVGEYFAYARDRAVHGAPSAPYGCSLSGVLKSSALSLEEKRQFFDAELSFGRVDATADEAVLTIEQSTLPFREGRQLGRAELCRADAQVDVSDETAARMYRVLRRGCDA